MIFNNNYNNNNNLYNNNTTLHYNNNKLYDIHAKQMNEWTSQLCESFFLSNLFQERERERKMEDEKNYRINVNIHVTGNEGEKEGI